MVEPGEGHAGTRDGRPGREKARVWGRPVVFDFHNAIGGDSRVAAQESTSNVGGS